MGWPAFLFAYLLGGITFIPLALAAVLLHAHLTLPIRDDATSDPKQALGSEDILQPGDETTDLDEAKKSRKEQPKQRVAEDVETAAGYFAVCREYIPMGINAKPIERSTPVGSATVAAPSQSVYQSMYRSIFDRKQTSGPLDDNRNVSQRPKKAGNVFYVVLRHGHLMLFDDDEQLEVRHVISLAHHDVSIYSGGEPTPEGELYIKRNALCLTRRLADKSKDADATPPSKPFYLFSENCSAKEDFYFSLLKNQEQTFGSHNIAPKPQRFDVKHIISLVQKLHASEDHMQTRWLNAFLGRIFLGIYRTKDIENLIREKLTKKISRVNRPSFLTRIAIQNISVGDSAPYFTSPRLKDLNVEGECVMEADVKYTGNFRLEVAAVARIDLGTRLKARDINLVLAVVLKKLEGHVYFKIKPPPSNRIWFSFQSMPKIEMAIEPIVSSRQITYTVILRQIENRIKEVIAETLVNPFWDDIPFFSTEHKRWRGGIFEGDDEVEHSPDHEEIEAQLGHVDEVSRMEGNGQSAPQPLEIHSLDKSQPQSVPEGPQGTGFWNRLNTKKSSAPNGSLSTSGSSTALDHTGTRTGNSTPDPAPPAPHPIRSGSFTAPIPVVGTDEAHAEVFRASSPPEHDDALSTMANITAKSQQNSPVPTPIGSPTKAPTTLLDTATAGNTATEEIAERGLEATDSTPTEPVRRSTISSISSSTSENDRVGSPARSTKSGVSATGSVGRGLFARKDSSASSLTNTAPDNKRNTLAAVSNAAATAKRWGWNAIQRQGERNPHGRKMSDPPLDLNQPMGRGQPLPPPGTPLPGPGQKVTPVSASKRKPVATPPSLSRQSTASVDELKGEKRVAPPPLPRRRRVSESLFSDEGNEENVLVVEAPTDSGPDSPSMEDTGTYMQAWAEDDEELEAPSDIPRLLEQASATPPLLVPQLPERPTPELDPEPDKPRMATPAVKDDDEDAMYASWADDPMTLAHH